MNPASKPTAVFTIRDKDGSIKYVGTTEGSVEKRLTQLYSQARNEHQALYNTAIGAWLRSVFEEAKFQPGYSEEKRFPNKDAAKEYQQKLIKANPNCLNVVKNIPFKKVK